jgi:hypothetical protein
MFEPIESSARPVRPKNTWRTSFEVEIENSSCEFQIVRTGISAYTVFLDGVSLDAQLTIPKIYFSSQDVRLPDGSSVTVRLGPFGWSAKRNGSKLSHISRSPVAGAILVGSIGIAALMSLYFFDSWSSTPQYEKSNPPVWAFLGISNNGHRLFINTQAVRRRVATAQVEVLVRTQAVAPGESEKTDTPKEDESTTVELLTCDPKADLYAVMVNMKTFEGKSFPNELPPDSELYGGAMQNFSRSRITEGTVSIPIWNAACFLGFHRKNAATTESSPVQPTQSQALNTPNTEESPNKLITLRDFDAVLVTVRFNTFDERMLTAEKAQLGSGALAFIGSHRQELQGLKSAAHLQEQKLSKANAATTLLSEPISLSPQQSAQLGKCASDWNQFMRLHTLFADLLMNYASSGNRRYFDEYISARSKTFKQLGPPAEWSDCKSW